MIGATEELENKPVLSLWDLRTEPLSLGGLLNMSIETLCVASSEGVSTENVLCLISDDQHPLPGGLEARDDSPMDLTASLAAAYPPLAAVISMNVFSEVWATHDPEAVAGYITGADRPFRLHPEESPTGQVNHDYESTLLIQEHYRDQGAIPRLVSKGPASERARDLLRSHTNGSDYVIVHPKNDPRGYGAENARIEIWAEFMSRPQVANTTFVVIGNDDFALLRDHPNVVLTQSSGDDLARDLALVNIGRIFMGTASGPAHMAILGTRPYAIYKPMHVHAEFMARELGGRQGYPFAGEDQYFIRIDPTPDDLLAALRRLVG